MNAVDIDARHKISFLRETIEDRINNGIGEERETAFIN